MNPYLLTSAVGAIALITSTAAHAVPFTPPSDNTAPRFTTGGASRSGFFTPPTDSPVPQRAAGGASRGSFFTPPTDSPAPRRAAGGASRGDASTLVRGHEDETSLTAASLAMLGLVPQSFYGTTIAAHPTILVYLPASDAQEVVFSLKDEDRNLRYYVTLPIAGEAGVYAFRMPADIPGLAVNANYQWFVALKQEGRLTPGSPFVEGWIKRIEASPQLTASLSALSEDDGLAQAKTLGGAGVWYDTVATLALLRSQQPESDAIAFHWSELLTSVGLQDISTAPLVTDVVP
jgi:Domain of Unknown Function (DUF928)